MQVSINAFLRNPPISGRSHQQLYGEFLEMMEYADQNGIARVALAEHHFEDDGYLPSQFVMAGAIAARTKRMEIYRVMTPEECTEFMLRQRQVLGDWASLNLRPTMGGMPAELGQEGLELVVNEVMPRVRDAGAS